VPRRPAPRQGQRGGEEQTAGGHDRGANGRTRAWQAGRPLRGGREALGRWRRPDDGETEGKRDGARERG
jgi:hypothetical protein